MADTPDSPARPLDRVEQEFIDLWRGMASLWGISPSMAQVHGFLFICGESLSMDDLMDRLGISRGNVSMNLTRLVEWGLVRRVHRRGDRRDYYEALGDVWEMFTLVAAQRKRREIDPMLATLRGCEEQLAALPEGGRVADQRRRVGDLVQFLALMDVLAQRFFESHKSLRNALTILSKDE
ncbi:MAG: GbsR/MarR family transcriptional regulator [Gemmataceae bacterium]